MEKTIFTSGNYAFEAFSDDGVLYSSQRIQEYQTLIISNLTQNIQKIVKLNAPAIDSDLQFLSLRVNRSIVADLALNIEIWRGTDYIDFISLTKDTIPFNFPNGSVIDPIGKNTLVPIELRVTANKNVDKVYLICTKCYVYAPIELMENY